MNRKRFQMASCSKDVVHRVGKVTLKCPKSGDAIHNWLNRRVRRLARSSPWGGSCPGSSRSVEQASRIEIMGQATLVSPLMDGVGRALLSFKPPVVGVQSHPFGRNLGLSSFHPGGLRLSILMGLCHRLPQLC